MSALPPLVQLLLRESRLTFPPFLHLPQGSLMTSILAMPFFQKQFGTITTGSTISLSEFDP